MRIRTKIILTVLPLLIGTLLLTEGASYITASNGITRITQQFFNFKINTLYAYMRNQWELLTEQTAEQTNAISAGKNALQQYAKSMLFSNTEIILAIDPAGTVVMTTSPLEISPEETAQLLPLLQEEQQDLKFAVLGGTPRVFRSIYCGPFNWYILITEEHAVFYQDINATGVQTLAVIGGAVLLMTVLLLILAGGITKPLSKTVQTMQTVINSGDLSARAEVTYQDETGNIAHTFNLMIGSLEKASHCLKQYALKAVISQKKEERIRQIFQKYVPKKQIDAFFAAPASGPAVHKQEIAVLFSDVRGFTAIAEKMPPNDLIDSLNRCFSDQVTVIMNRNGIVDKYIGDAIMAFWGAPNPREDDAMQSVFAGLELLDAVKKFNDRQRVLGKPEFNVGIGIDYGPAMAGNVGGERKMEYTILGDAVHTASRLEKLTKVYKEDLLISESLYTAIKNKEPKLPIRLLDTVAVKGKNQGVKIYTVKRSVTVPEAKAWGYYHEGMSLYYRRSFEEAVQQFRKALIILHEDPTAEILLARALAYADNPPPQDWNGIDIS
jgi:class 3 adenylate cyclase/HAMP domain-containing protein